MVELACEVDARFSASDMDAPRADGAPNYTVDTLAALRERCRRRGCSTLLARTVFLTMRRWHEPDRLLEAGGVDCGESAGLCAGGSVGDWG